MTEALARSLNVITAQWALMLGQKQFYQYLERFGFGTVSQRFFPVQGGVFHLVMVMFYVTAARAPERHRDLVRLAVATKTLAFVFLASYFFAVERIVTVLLSGVADGAMAAAIAALAARAKG